jgi:hypothetical protein
LGRNNLLGLAQISSNTGAIRREASPSLKRAKQICAAKGAKKMNQYKISAEHVSRILQRIEETEAGEIKRIGDLLHDNKSVWNELFKMSALDAIRGIASFLRDNNPAQAQASEIGLAIIFYIAGFAEGVAAAQAQSLENLYQK